MTSSQLKAELYRQIDLYADNDDVLEKVLDFFKRLTRKKPDDSLMTKEDFVRMINKSKRQAEDGKVKTFSDINEMHNWLNAL